MTRTKMPAVRIAWSEEDHRYLAEMPDLPGVVADGQTQTEALENAHKMAADWVETAQSLLRPIPVW